VIVDWINPISRFFTVTATVGSPTPSVSKTVPTKEPDSRLWAREREVRKAKDNRKRKGFLEPIRPLLNPNVAGGWTLLNFLVSPGRSAKDKLFVFCAAHSHFL